MSEWYPIIAKPNFDGLDQEIWKIIAVFAIWLCASIYTTRRLKMVGDYERLGLPFWCAAAIAIGGFLYVPLVMIVR